MINASIAGGVSPPRLTCHFCDFHTSANREVTRSLTDGNDGARVYKIIFNPTKQGQKSHDRADSVNTEPAGSPLTAVFSRAAVYYL